MATWNKIVTANTDGSITASGTQAGSPNFAFAEDPDCGIYYNHSTQKFAIALDGDRKMYMSNSGATAWSDNISMPSMNIGGTQVNGTLWYSSNLRMRGSSSGDVTFQAYEGALSVGPSATGGNYDLRLQSTGTGDLELKTNGSNALVLNSSQNATFAGNVEINGTGILTIDSSTSVNLYLDRSASNKHSSAVFQTAGSTNWAMGLTDSDVSGVDGSEFYIGQTANGTSNALKIDTSNNATFAGNVNISTVALPSGMASSSYDQLRVSTGTVLADSGGTNSASMLMQNAYVGSGNNNYFGQTSWASRLMSTMGAFTFSNASGSADGQITWSDKLTIAQGGNATFGGNVDIKSGSTTHALNVTADAGQYACILNSGGSGNHATLKLSNGSGSHTGNAIYIQQANSGKILDVTATLGSSSFEIGATYNGASPDIISTGGATFGGDVLLGTSSGGNKWLNFSTTTGDSGITWFETGTYSVPDHQYGAKMYYDASMDRLYIDTRQNGATKHHLGFRRSTISTEVYGNLQFAGTYGMVFYDTAHQTSSSANNAGDYVKITAPTSIGTSYTIKWPNNAGSANNVMKVDGSGNLSWTPHQWAEGINDCIEWEDGDGHLHNVEIEDGLIVSWTEQT